MNGTVEIVELDAPSLEGNPLGDPSRRSMPVYLPPGYQRGSERFPVVYFLHGFTGAGTKWVSFPGFGVSVPQRIDQLISSGAIPPVIGVFVDGWTAIGGSQWINSDAIGRYGDYLAKDVVGWVDRELRTVAKADGRACVGSSSGGYGSLVAGRDHPDVFAHIASHSGDAYFEYGYLGDLPKAAGAVLKAGGVVEWFNDFWKRSRETKSRNEDHAVLNALAMAAAYSPKKGEPMNIELPFDRETARIKPEVWARWLEHDPVRFIPRSARCVPVAQVGVRRLRRARRVQPPLGRTDGGRGAPEDRRRRRPRGVRGRPHGDQLPLRPVDALPRASACALVIRAVRFNVSPSTATRARRVPRRAVRAG